MITASNIPEHECPIVRPRRTLPVMGPYPHDWIATHGGDIFYVDHQLRAVYTRNRRWLLEPATVVTCQHGHRHIAALRFAPE